MDSHSPTIPWYSSAAEFTSIDEFRSYLLEQPFYVASPNFLRETSWHAYISQDTLSKASVSGFESQFMLSIVGVISSQGLYMEPHGNFAPDGSMDFENKTTRSLAQAEYKFSLRAPVGHPGFLVDFETAMDHVRIIQEQVATPPEDYWWDTETLFFDSDASGMRPIADIDRVFNWTFPIFQKTGLASSEYFGVSYFNILR
jgi:hypothetical protein